MFKMLFEIYKDCKNNWKDKISVIFHFIMVAFGFFGGTYILLFNDCIKYRIFGFIIVVIYVFAEGWIWGFDI